MQVHDGFLHCGILLHDGVFLVLVGILVSDVLLLDGVFLGYDGIFGWGILHDGIFLVHDGILYCVFQLHDGSLGYDILLYDEILVVQDGVLCWRLSHASNEMIKQIFTDTSSESQICLKFIKVCHCIKNIGSFHF